MSRKPDYELLFRKGSCTGSETWGEGGGGEGKEGTVEQDRRKLTIRFSFVAGLLLGNVHSVVHCLHYPSNYCLYRMGDLAHYQEGGGDELRPNWGCL